MISKVLSLDLSTSCTGFSVFDLNTKKLLEYKAIKSNTKGLAGMTYPELTLTKMVNYAKVLREEIIAVNPSIIVIEEIAGSKQRLGQKTLDGMHWILLFHIPEYLKKVYYYDVSGTNGWRTHLQLRLTDEDKKHNAQLKKFNKQIHPNQTPLKKIGFKHLSQRYANHIFGLTLNVDERVTDGDIADSLCMGYSFLKNCMK